MHIYTQDFTFLAKGKRLIKWLLGRNFGGPQAVQSSLERGLKELGISFVRNEKHPPTNSIACVLSGINTLAWAIAQKQAGKIRAIVAGPNLVVMPHDAQRILLSPEIDRVVVPAEWVKSKYSQLGVAPERIKVWPAGVTIPFLENKKTVYDVLVYNKMGSSPIYSEIVKELQQQGLRFAVINYGSFKREHYYNLLNQTRVMVYLSASESQGLALFEAWAHNVPVLAYESGVFRNGTFELIGRVATEYVSPVCGLIFNTAEEFKAQLPHILKTFNFSPRSYIKEHFTDAVCAQKYLDIVNELM